MELNEDMNKMKTKSFLKNSLLAGITIGTISLGTTQLIKSTLKPENFQKAKWFRAYNPNGRIWSYYMKEDIPHTQINWYAYETEVKKRNNGKLEGDIFLPDLDNNGKIGK